MHHTRSGFALITTLLMITVLAVLLTSYHFLTQNELRHQRSSADSISGFYAAEGGLNVRAAAIREKFVGYNRPAGSAPDDRCLTGSTGSADFACQPFSLAGRTVQTYVVPVDVTGRSVTIPSNQPYGGLNAIEYTYDVFSAARNAASHDEAVLSMRFQSRLVPMFQFAAFYDNDLEILPGPNMDLNGRVHSNRNLYVNSSGSTLTFRAQITAGGDLYRGRKDSGSCTGTVRVYDPGSPRSLDCAGSTTLVPQSALGPWNGAIRTNVAPLNVPKPSSLNPVSGNTLWEQADVRIMWNPAANRIEFQRANGDIILSRAAPTGGFVDGLGVSASFRNNREGKTIRMLEIDQKALMNYLQLNASVLLGPGKNIDDTSGGGLALYVGVNDPQAGNACSETNPGDCIINDFGVRVRGGDQLGAAGSAPEIQGLTFISNQAMYVMGDYNTSRKKPASFLADSLNVLSNAWTARAWPNHAGSNGESQGAIRSDGNGPDAANTSINAAFLAGTDISTPGGGNPGYNGGLENYPRFHEDWHGRTLRYRGSFVSLGTPSHVNGTWFSQTYRPPVRDWNYDTDFNDAANLPPLAPRFVYLHQQLFARNYNP